MADKRMTREQLERMLSDLKWHDEWRKLANRDVAYYDGKQLTSDLVREKQNLGLAPLIRNYVRPTVDLVLGMEAKNKRDWKVIEDDDDAQETAEALTVELKKAERASNADRACSDAYASMVKAGIGWVEVAREADPFKPPHRVSAVHRNEISFDWRAREPDFSDGRFLVRHRWFDVDTLENWFPRKAGLIRNIRHDTANWDVTLLEGDEELLRALNDGSETNLQTREWLDTERKRLRLYEVWYKVWVNGFVLRLPQDRVIEFDPENFKHMVLVATGAAVPEPARFMRIRQSYWIGPHQLTDNPSPYPHNHFPYVPFVATREDGIGSPMGLVRHMISPQDEINTRLSKMMWLLSAKRIIADTDAFERPLSEVRQEAARPDAVILLDPHRTNKNADAVRVESDFALSAQQFEVMLDATRAIQDVAGVYQAQLGKESAADSGVAINSLVEQGSTTLAEMNDNYRYSRKRVGELLLALIKEDIGNGEHKVAVERNGRRKKNIVLNQRVEDDGMTYLSNSVVQSRLHVELEDVPQTASYRQHQFTMMTEIIKSLPPDIIPLFADMMVKVSDLPNRDELVKRVQNHLGLAQDPEDMTPEEHEAAAAQQRAQQEAEMLALEEQRKTVEKLAAEIEEIFAKVRKIEAEANKTEEETILEQEERTLELARNADAPSERERFDQEKKNRGPKPNSARA